LALISETAGREDNKSGYVRLFGHTHLGKLMSRVHATVIRSGNELERLLEHATPQHLRVDLPDAIRRANNPESKGLSVVFRPRLKMAPGRPNITGDVVVLNHDRKEVSIIEVKDGDTFDTKKASGERASLQASADQLHRETGYTPSIFFCSFNQDSKEAIVAGAKNRFTLAEVMTGRQLCGILNIPFNSFVAKRRHEQATNVDYFLAQLCSMPDIAQRLRETLR